MFRSKTSNTIGTRRRISIGSSQHTACVYSYCYDDDDDGDYYDYYNDCDYCYYY